MLRHIGYRALVTRHYVASGPIVLFPSCEKTSLILLPYLTNEERVVSPFPIKGILAVAENVDLVVLTSPG